MGRHYSTKDFFRQISNALLARYFHTRGLFGDLDFSAMKETQPDQLFAAWLTLPDSQRNEMDAEFREIFELSCEKGFRAIIDEAEWHLAAKKRGRQSFASCAEPDGEWIQLVGQFVETTDLNFFEQRERYLMTVEIERKPHSAEPSDG